MGTDEADDLQSSVHGTWLSGKKIQPNIHVELIEGDAIRFGAWTRIYCLHWMPLSHAFKMVKPMSPFMEEALDFENNDEALLDESFNETWVSNIIPSVPPLRVSFPESVSYSWPLKEEIGVSKNFPANEMLPETEELSPLISNKIIKSSSLLLRRNQPIVYLYIETFHLSKLLVL